MKKTEAAVFPARLPQKKSYFRKKNSIDFGKVKLKQEKLYFLCCWKVVRNLGLRIL